MAGLWRWVLFWRGVLRSEIGDVRLEMSDRGFQTSDWSAAASITRAILGVIFLRTLRRRNDCGNRPKGTQRGTSSSPSN